VKPLFWLTSIAVTILASEIAIANPNIDRDRAFNTRPFNLVHLGYQGYFQDEGIPSYAAFHAAIENRRVTATQLIESAIEKGRLHRDALNDRDYINAVETHLELILRNKR
jgi:hypothetical protein